MAIEPDVTLDQPARRAGDLTEYRLKLLERAVHETSLALAGINSTLQQLATLEVRHTETREALQRAFESIKALNGRLEAVELKMPVLTLTSNWVRVGVIRLVGLVAVAVVKLILVTH